MISIFNHKTISKLLGHFEVREGDYITPIRAELLTPSLTCMLYRVVDHDNKEHFFVCLVFRQLRSLVEAQQTIESWHGKVLEFVQPVNTAHDSQSDLDKTCSHQGIYRLLLARVSKPRGTGYWGTRTTIMPGDSINEKLAHLKIEDREVVAEKLKDVLANKVIATETFLNNYRVKKNENIAINDINTSNVAATVFIAQTGKQEIFYSYAPVNDSSKNGLRTGKIQRVRRRAR